MNFRESPVDIESVVFINYITGHEGNFVELWLMAYSYRWMKLKIYAHDN